MLDFCVKTGMRFSLRDKRLFEITEVEISRVDCIVLYVNSLCSIEVCVYNGKSYAQGQRWQDGCQYDCECLDAMTGQYRCTDR